MRKKLAFAKAAERVKEVRETVSPRLQSIQLELNRRKKLLELRASVPPIFDEFFQPFRYKGAHGGRGSAKSWSFAQMLLDRCVKVKGTRAVCVREVQKSLEQSVKRLLEDLIERFHLGHLFRVLNTHIETPGDGIIIFQGMQNHTADSIKSLEGYDIAWVEEAQSLSQRSLDLLRPTLRKEDSEIWFTWNPLHATDPVDSFLRPIAQGAQLPSNVLVRKISWQDNPYFPDVLRAELEWDQRRDPDKYDHIWMGGYERHSEARVFKNWRVEEFDTPIGPDNIVPDFLFGGDWGFAVDPTVGVRGWVGPGTRTLFVDWEVYRVGCEIDDTPALFDALGCDQPHSIHGTTVSGCTGMARSWQIVTDSARPETISYMQKHGYTRVIGAKKGAGSIEDGIEFLKNYDIIVHPRCRHVIDELSAYCYKKHPLTDQILPVLVDKKNHTIDSLRYMVESLRTPFTPEFVTW